MAHPKAADEYITQVELAKRLGMTTPAVAKLKNAGKIVMAKRDGKQMVAYQATLKLLGDTLHPSYSHKGLKAVRNAAMLDETDAEPDEYGETHVTLAEAQRRKAVAAAALAELELAEKSGTLIDKAGAEKAIFEFVRGLRDAIENFPVRYAAQIGAELGAPAVKVNAALTKRLKDYLGELADRQLRL
jgi:hypothetical protein